MKLLSEEIVKSQINVYILVREYQRIKTKIVHENLYGKESQRIIYFL